MIRKKQTRVLSSSRVEAKRERMRELIFEAAARQFAQRGFHATKMQDIARAAGFSAPSLYGYFQGKDEILQALAESVQREFQESFDEPLPPLLDFERKFDVLLHRLVAYFERHREAVGFLFFAEQELAGSRGGLKGFAMVSDQFARWLAAHSRRGDLGRCSARVAAQYLTGIIYAGFYRWSEKPDQPVTRAVDEIREVFFRGVTGGAS